MENARHSGADLSLRGKVFKRVDVTVYFSESSFASQVLTLCVRVYMRWQSDTCWCTMLQWARPPRRCASWHISMIRSWRGKLDTGENIPAPGVEFGSATRLQNHAARCNSDAATGFTEAMPLPAHRLQHTCTLSQPRTQYATPHTHAHTLGWYTVNMST